MENLDFGFSKKLPVMLQTEASECGLACIAMIATYHGHHLQMAELRKHFVVSVKGTNLSQLSSIAEQLGMQTRALRVDLADLEKLQLPAMLHWNLNHFVVLKEIRGNTVVLHDPAVGHIKMNLTEVSEHFTGVVLEFMPGLKFSRKSAAPPLQLSQLVGKIVGLKRGLFQLFALAIALEVLALLMPIFTQWVMDGAIVSADRPLLTLLGLGMIGIGLTQATISAFRSWVGLYISTTFNMQWMSNVMSHLLRLPVEYFERRHIGDVVSRFGTVQTIQHTLTSSAVEAMLDGILALGTALMMSIYSPKLSLVTVASVLVYASWRWARYQTLRMAQVNALAKHAKEQTFFLETIRGVRSIKLSNRERSRANSWMNLWVDATNASLQTQKLNLMYGVSWSYLSTVERVAVLWLGASAVIDHTMSVGMLFAFLSYKEQFSSRVNTLIDRFVDYKMLTVQTERLADIVMHAPEEADTHRDHVMPEDMTLSLQTVKYTYAGDDKPTLNNVSLKVLPGECVALVGASGAGKTTCLKLMLGILKPRSGSIRIGGIKLSQIGLRQYRDIVATVMQDDHLFAGSIYDNICFMAEKPDEKWLMECAKIACIHDEIMSMNMGYHTLIGDMGTAMSGGQQQRLLLARALYRKPKILFLDEATSHLDLENEARISEAIAALAITRIIIAHRPQTIAIADRIIKVENGKLNELRMDGNEIRAA